MKFILFVVFLVVNYASNGQVQQNTKIDTSNYYSYFSAGKNVKGKNLMTSWLSLDDVVPILLYEMKEAGFGLPVSKWKYKVDSVQTVTLAAYSRKRDIGFLYSGDHEMIPTRKHRQHLLLKKYIVFEDNPSGEADFITIEQAPPNIFILNPDLYWYQSTDEPEDNAKLVTRQIALNILRMDVRKILASRTIHR